MWVCPGCRKNAVRFVCSACHTAASCSHQCAEAAWVRAGGHRTWCHLIAGAFTEDEDGDNTMSLVAAKRKERPTVDPGSPKPARKRARDEVTGAQIVAAIEAAGGISPYIVTSFRRLPQTKQKDYAKRLKDENAAYAAELTAYMTRTQVDTVTTVLSNRFACPPLDVTANVMYRNARPVIRFGSGLRMPNAKFSNFYSVEVRLTAADVAASGVAGAIRAAFPDLEAWLGAGATFPSTEHAYQALKAADEATFRQFTTTGALGAWPSGDQHPFAASPSAKDRAETFAKFRKADKPLIGIVAKMAVNRNRAARLGLRLRDARQNMPTAEWQTIEKALWLDLVLRAKYDPGPHRDLYELLVCTADAYLLEFGRRARADGLDPRRPAAYWGGALTLEPTDPTDWRASLQPTLFGVNAMGVYLMLLRSRLAKRDLPPGERTRDLRPPRIEAGVVLFWRPDQDENPFLSNWYLRPFYVAAENQVYSSMEQYLMAGKARLFGDAEMRAKILATHSPKRQKSLGRQVRGFDEATWVAERRGIVERGLRAKFPSPASALGGYLLATGDARLAESSPYDTVWGTGLKPTHPNAREPARWRGQNLLGELLEVRRAELRAVGV